MFFHIPGERIHTLPYNRSIVEPADLLKVAASDLKSR